MPSNMSANRSIFLHARLSVMGMKSDVAWRRSKLVSHYSFDVSFFFLLLIASLIFAELENIIVVLIHREARYIFLQKQCFITESSSEKGNSLVKCCRKRRTSKWNNDQLLETLKALCKMVFSTPTLYFNGARPKKLMQSTEFVQCFKWTFLYIYIYVSKWNFSVPFKFTGKSKNTLRLEFTVQIDKTGTSSHHNKITTSTYFQHNMGFFLVSVHSEFSSQAFSYKSYQMINPMAIYTYTIHLVEKSLLQREEDFQ